MMIRPCKPRDSTWAALQQYVTGDQASCLAPPGYYSSRYPRRGTRVLHGLAAPDRRGEIRVRGAHPHIDAKIDGELRLRV